jgi:hypothetical protein
VADAQRAMLSAGVEGDGPAVAGLHGGRAERTPAGLRLRRYSYVRGVTLSGTVPDRRGRALRMIVGGRAAAKGRFTVSGGRVRGRLGGRRIDAATSPPAARAASWGAPAIEPAPPPFPRLARVG